MIIGVSTGIDTVDFIINCKAYSPDYKDMSTAADFLVYYLSY